MILEELGTIGNHYVVVLVVLSGDKGEMCVVVVCIPVNGYK